MIGEEPSEIGKSFVVAAAELCFGGKQAFSSHHEGFSDFTGLRAGQVGARWLYPPRPPVRRAHGCVAQLVEQLTLNQRVTGSIPVAPTKITKINQAFR